MTKYELLKEAVSVVIDSYDYMNMSFINPTSPKLGKCIHGEYVYESCENCICEFLEKRMKEIDEG